MLAACSALPATQGLDGRAAVTMGTSSAPISPGGVWTPM